MKKILVFVGKATAGVVVVVVLQGGKCTSNIFMKRALRSSVAPMHPMSTAAASALTFGSSGSNSHTSTSTTTSSSTSSSTTSSTSSGGCCVTRKVSYMIREKESYIQQLREDEALEQWWAARIDSLVEDGVTYE